jgi:hypothetical protein
LPAARPIVRATLFIKVFSLAREIDFIFPPRERCRDYLQAAGKRQDHDNQQDQA